MKLLICAKVFCRESNADSTSIYDRVACAMMAITDVTIMVKLNADFEGFSLCSNQWDVCFSREPLEEAAYGGGILTDVSNALLFSAVASSSKQKKTKKLLSVIEMRNDLIC